MSPDDELTDAMNVERAVDLLDESIDDLRAAALATASGWTSGRLSDAALGAYDASYRITMAASLETAQSLLKRVEAEIDQITEAASLAASIQRRIVDGRVRSLRVAIGRRWEVD